WYVVGNNVNGSQQWNPGTDNVMSEVSNGVFEWKGTELGGTGFKINNGSWNNDDTNIGSNGEMLVVGTPYQYGFGGSSQNIQFDGKVVNPVVTLDRNAGTITVKGAEEEITSWEVYLAGSFNEYNSSDADYKFSEAGNGVYTLHLDSFDADFKIVSNGSWFGYVESAVESGVEYSLYDTGMDNSKLTAAATDVTFKYNAKANTLVVTYKTEGGVVTPPVADFPEALYLIGGTINGSAWNPAEATAMTKNGNVFEVAAEVSGVGESADVYFSFLTITGADWDAVNGADRWGAGTNDEEISFGTPATIVCYPFMVNASSAASYKLTLPSATDVYNCVFTVDFSNNTVKVVNNGITGVAAVVADEAPVYFNLQGVKVAEPTNGIYVKVANGKATKVVINK
ncbi:MAG: hypothetical protein K2M03_04110, partial [Muribaculaceae bacterium]|nr:hypothetical protein [Muribaculaceae bacterium]